jgi:hypothetical protein
MDTLDDRQGLSGERQDMSAAIIRIRYALDEAGRLQPLFSYSWRSTKGPIKPPSLKFSTSGQLRSFACSTASSESPAWELGVQRAVVATASQLGCLVQ